MSITNMYKAAEKVAGRKLNPQEKHWVNLHKRTLRKLRQLKASVNNSLPEGRINTIIGQLRSAIIPHIAEQRPFNHNLASFREVEVYLNDEDWEGTSASSIIYNAIDAAQNGRIGEARLHLKNVQRAVGGVVAQELEQIFDYVNSLENEIEPILDNVRHALQRNDLKGALSELGSPLANIDNLSNEQANQPNLILEKELNRVTTTQKAITEIEALLNEQKVPEAAVRLRQYRDEMGLVQAHEPETFAYETASYLAVQSHQKRVAQEIPSSVIENSAQWSVVYDALQTDNPEFIKQQLGIEFYYKIPGISDSVEDMRFSLIRQLALACPADRLDILTELIQQIANTDRGMYSGTGSGWEWGDAQDIHYTHSHQKDKARVKSFAIIAQKLLQNESAEAFSLLNRSIPLIPLSDQQIIRRDDHGDISFYAYTISPDLGVGGTVKDSVATRVLHITEQTVAASTNVFANVAANVRVNEALKAAALLSGTTAFLGIFFNRIWTTYKTTYIRAINLNHNIARKLQQISQDKALAQLKDRLSEMAKLHTQLADSLAQDRYSKDIRPEEKSAIAQLSKHWQEILGNQAPTFSEGLLNS
jgi:hypothetical protein